MLGSIMGGGPMGMIKQLMHMVQQMQQQQGGECGQCSEGGHKNPAQAFHHVLQQELKALG